MKDYLQSIKFFEQYNEDVNKFSLLCVRLLETQEWKALSLIIKEKAGVLVSQANDKNKLNGVEFFTISLDKWQQGATITDDLKTMNTIPDLWYHQIQLSNSMTDSVQQTFIKIHNLFDQDPTINTSWPIECQDYFRHWISCCPTSDSIKYSPHHTDDEIHHTDDEIIEEKTNKNIEQKQTQSMDLHHEQSYQTMTSDVPVLVDHHQSHESLHHETDNSSKENTQTKKAEETVDHPVSQGYEDDEKEQYDQELQTVDTSENREDDVAQSSEVEPHEHVDQPPTDGQLQPQDVKQQEKYEGNDDRPLNDQTGLHDEHKMEGEEVKENPIEKQAQSEYQDVVEESPLPLVEAKLSQEIGTQLEIQSEKVNLDQITDSEIQACHAENCDQEFDHSEQVDQNHIQSNDPDHDLDVETSNTFKKRQRRKKNNQF